MGRRRGGTGINRNVSPSDISDIVGEFAVGSSAGVDRAIASAGEAFPAWSRSNPLVRAEILARIGDEIVARHRDLGELLSREEGKILTEGIGEALRAGLIRSPQINGWRQPSH